MSGTPGAASKAGLPAKKLKAAALPPAAAAGGSAAAAVAMSRSFQGVALALLWLRTSFEGVALALLWLRTSYGELGAGAGVLCGCRRGLSGDLDRVGGMSGSLWESPGGAGRLGRRQVMLDRALFLVPRHWFWGEPA